MNRDRAPPWEQSAGPPRPGIATSRHTEARGHLPVEWDGDPPGEPGARGKLPG